MAKAKAAADGEVATVDEAREKAKASLAVALAKRPGLEGDLADLIAYLNDGEA